MSNARPEARRHQDQEARREEAQGRQEGRAQGQNQHCVQGQGCRESHRCSLWDELTSEPGPCGRQQAGRRDGQDLVRPRHQEQGAAVGSQEGRHQEDANQEDGGQEGDEVGVVP
jgi:hypothetical protein